MKTARWRLAGSQINVWLDNAAPERMDWAANLRWMEELVAKRPFVILDDAEPWNLDFVGRHGLRIAHATWGKSKMVLFGCRDAAVLDDHQALAEQSWISGLTLIVFDSEETMRSRMISWHGRKITALEDFLTEGVHRIVGMRYDGVCVAMWPGLDSRETLLAEAERIAGLLGYQWGPL